MSRVAVCLLFIAIFHYEILTFSQANETATEDVTNNKEEIIKQPTINVDVNDSEAVSKIATANDSELPSKIEPIKDSDVPSRKEVDERSGVPSKKELTKDSNVPQNINDKIKEVDANPNESKKGDVTEKAKSGETGTEKSSTTPIEQSNSNKDFPNNILGPVMEVRTKIEDVVFKGVDSAKNIADGAVNFLRTTVSNILN